MGVRSSKLIVVSWFLIISFLSTTLPCSAKSNGGKEVMCLAPLSLLLTNKKIRVDFFEARSQNIDVIMKFEETEEVGLKLHDNGALDKVVYSSEKYQMTITFGTNGLPDFVTINGVIVKFGNYTDSYVDVALIGEGIDPEIQRSLPINSAIFEMIRQYNQNPISSARSEINNFRLNTTSDLSTKAKADFIAIGAFTVSGIVCVLGLLGAPTGIGLAFAYVGCAGAVVSGANIFIDSRELTEVSKFINMITFNPVGAMSDAYSLEAYAIEDKATLEKLASELDSANKNIKLDCWWDDQGSYLKVCYDNQTKLRYVYSQISFNEKEEISSLKIQKGFDGTSIDKVVLTLVNDPYDRMSNTSSNTTSFKYLIDFRGLYRVQYSCVKGGWDSCPAGKVCLVKKDEALQYEAEVIKMWQNTGSFLQCDKELDNYIPAQYSNVSFPETCNQWWDHFDTIYWKECKY